MTAFIDQLFAKTFTTGDETATAFLEKLMKVSREGHLFLEDPSIQDKISHLLEGDKSPLVHFESCYYLRRNFELETLIIKQLQNLLYAQPKLTFSVKPDSDLYPEQAKALQLAMSSSLTIITGGPGCGKTYLANKIIETLLLKMPNAHIIATAPTGKAASRFQNKKITSQTLHSLLGIYETIDRQPAIKPLIADLIIVDECSMIDLKLWSYLLSSIAPGTSVILMGDPDQLPPVEGGAIFEEFCNIKAINTVHLNKTLRSQSSSLQQLSHFVKHGKGKEAIELFSSTSDSDISFLPLNKFTPNENLGSILTPFHKGPFGTQAINEQIYSLSNAKVRPIIITKNDYQLGLMNGDIGFIEDDIAVFNDSSFASSLLYSYDLAWAISIHKSQGSEFDHVCILLPENSELFGRKLLYTAITRAKKSVTIFGDSKTFLQITSQITHPRSNLTKRFSKYSHLTLK